MEQLIGNHREDYISREAYHMGIAVLSAMRSKDPSTQVGACIVSEDNRILSTGYNGTPNGIEDVHFNWEREGDALCTKYPYVIHAEANAILNFRGNMQDMKGAVIFVTLFPCNECAKLIVQSGIQKVVYLSDKYHDKRESLAARKIFDACGVETVQYCDGTGEISILFEEARNAKTETGMD